VCPPKTEECGRENIIPPPPKAPAEGRSSPNAVEHRRMTRAVSPLSLRGGGVQTPSLSGHCVGEALMAPSLIGVAIGAGEDKPPSLPRGEGVTTPDPPGNLIEGSLSPLPSRDSGGRERVGGGSSSPPTRGGGLWPLPLRMYSRRSYSWPSGGITISQTSWDFPPTPCCGRTSSGNSGCG